MGEGLDNDEVVELHRRYGFFLRRRCLMLLGNPSLTDDTLQEIYVKLLRAGAGVKTAERPLHWLYRVADRACFDQMRKGKIRNTTPIDELPDVLPAAPGTDPETHRAARELLAALDDEDRRIAVMAFVDGMTQQEIADELGYARMTVVQRVARLRSRVARVMQEKPALRGH